jgi:transcriptional regulator with XRE-family HTH domain
MVIMFNVNSFSQTILFKLADRLKQARLARNESQEVFASRIGLSRQSYAKMEKGSATIAIGYWLIASDLLGRLNTWEGVLSEGENLFEQYEQKQKKRQRAGRQTKGSR